MSMYRSMQAIGIVFLCFFVFPFALVEVKAQESEVLVEVFERLDCGHCQAEKRFWAEEQRKDSTIEVVFRNIDEPAEKALFEALTKKESLSLSTPLTLIGTQVFQGFDRPETTGKSFLKALDSTRGKERIGVERFIQEDISSTSLSKGAICNSETGVCTNPKQELLVSIPFFGALDVASLSLPAISVVLGFVDGFNPCAMWVLVTFLLVLIQLESRERMIMVAGLFILAEAIMYYLILNVWFTTWDFIGLDRFVTPLIGLLAIGGGAFFLYEWKTSDGACKVIDSRKRVSIMASVKKLANAPLTWLTAVGIIGLAFSVNVIEFACSIGIPQAFTKILEMNALSMFQEQSLMGLYILFYMIDDLLVFGLALWGAEKLHLTQKYSHVTTLIGGVLMLLLGLLLLVSPETLRFV